MFFILIFLGIENIKVLLYHYLHIHFEKMNLYNLANFNKINKSNAEVSAHVHSIL